MPFSFTIFLAIKRWRIAHARTYSGTSSAHMNITTLFLKKHDVLWTHLGQKSISCVSTGSGTFGWTATHVHRKMVVMQLHIIPSSVRQLSISSHEDDVLDTSRAGAGRARAESKWTKKRKSMMHGRGQSWYALIIYIADLYCNVCCACSCRPHVRLARRALSTS